MKTLLLIGAFQAFFFSFLIIQKSRKALHDFILATWLIFLGLFITIYAFYSEELFIRLPHLMNTYISLFLLHGPFLYFYSLSLIQEKKKILWFKNLVHLIPFFTFNFYLIIAYQFSKISENIRIDYINAGNLPVLYVVFLMLIAISGPLYIVWTILLLQRHDVHILNNYSFTENITVAWLRRLIIIFGIIWTALIVFAGIHHVMFLFTRDFCTNGLFLSLSLFVIITGFYGLKQSVIITPGFVNIKTNISAEKKPYSTSKLKEEVANDFLRKLEEYMFTKKPYLNEKLTLQQLSEEVHIPPHYLSQIINTGFKKNFFDFINEYRIEEVKRKINDPEFKDYSILGIALDSGFNSKTTFNRFFKKITGFSPSEYKKIHSTGPTL